MLRKDAAVAVALFALVCSVALLTFSGVYHSSDEMAMLAATDSLARRGAWDVELIRWMGEQQGSFGPDGHLYSRKGIGTSLAALPGTWLALRSGRLGNVQAGMLTNAPVTALTAVAVYLLLRRLRYGEGPALGAALAYGLGTMAWPYARMLFSESLSALGLAVSALGLAATGVRPGRRRAAALWPLVAGAGLGLALLARLNSAIVAPFLAAWLLGRLGREQGRRWRAWLGPLLLFGLPVAAGLVTSAWYNWVRFGSPWLSGYLPEERFSGPFWEGVYGLLLSPGKGLVWYNPVLLAALAAWPAFVRRSRAAGWLAAAVVGSHVAFYASWYLWWSGHAWGPRFLLPTLPFACLPLAVALEAAARRRALAAGLALLAALSLAVQVLGVAVDFNLYAEDAYAALGLYHPDTLFRLEWSPLLRQWAYLRPGSLDLAWARGGVLNWGALGVALALLLASAAGLAAAWRGRLRRAAAGGLLLVLPAAAALSLALYAPSGGAARAARALQAMERPGEGVVLADPALTAAFQDAYDGRLPAWGDGAGRLVGRPAGTWQFGASGDAAAAARFQWDGVRLDLVLPAGQQFDITRLPGAGAGPWARLGEVAELLAPAPGAGRWAVRPGGSLVLDLAWRALAPDGTSYTLFVQAVGAGEVKAGQVDRLPCGGGCPTSGWVAGEVVGEQVVLEIGAGAQPGEYALLVGLYDLATGERLPAYGPQGRALDTALTLGTVVVGR